MTHFEQLSTHINSLQTKRILDLGCGKGAFLVDAAKRGASAQGLELSTEYIEEAYAAAQKSGVGINVAQGVAEHMPFADSSFDFVNICEVIEHVESPKEMLQEVKRVLAAGGEAYISVPNRFSLKDPHFHLYFVNWLPRAWADTFISIFGKHKQYEGTGNGRQRLAEMHYYTYSKVAALARSEGFTVTDIRAERIEKEYKGIKRIAAKIAYPFARTLYFDSFHLSLK
jgi:ubiquinone/menaquinone biosynthesis C-methylase UbiE